MMIITSLLNGLFSTIWTPIIITVISVLYWIFPLDIVPDYFPIVGRLDDYVLMGLVLISWGYYLGFAVTSWLKDMLADPTQKWVLIGIIAFIFLVVPGYLNKNKKHIGGA